MNVKRFMMKLFSLRTLIVCVIAFGIAGYFAFGAGNPRGPDGFVEPPTPKGWEERDNTSLAYIMMCDFVREECRIPSSTVFPPQDGPGVIAEKSYGTTYRVEGYVEAENEYGLRVITYYRGQIRETAPGAWKKLTLRTGSLEELSAY